VLDGREDWTRVMRAGMAMLVELLNLIPTISIGESSLLTTHWKRLKFIEQHLSVVELTERVSNSRGRLPYPNQGQAEVKIGTFLTSYDSFVSSQLELRWLSVSNPSLFFRSFDFEIIFIDAS
jgi:hypothetical protein